MIKWNENIAPNDSDYWFRNTHFKCAEFERYYYLYVYGHKVQHEKCNINEIELNFFGRCVQLTQQKNHIYIFCFRIRSRKKLTRAESGLPCAAYTRLDRFVEQSHNNCLNAHAAKILKTYVQRLRKAEIVLWWLRVARVAITENDICLESAMWWWRPCGMF